MHSFCRVCIPKIDLRCKNPPWVFFFFAIITMTNVSLVWSCFSSEDHFWKESLLKCSLPQKLSTHILEHSHVYYLSVIERLMCVKNKIHVRHTLIRFPKLFKAWSYVGFNLPFKGIKISWYRSSLFFFFSDMQGLEQQNFTRNTRIAYPREARGKN